MVCNVPLIFICGVGWRAQFTKERWIHETNRSLAFWMLLQHKETWRSTQTNSTQSSTWAAKCTEAESRIFKHSLSTVTNLVFKQQIKIKMKLPGSYFSLFITIHSAFVFADSNSYSLVTGQNLDTRSYELSFSQGSILSPPKILTFPADSTGM